MTQEEFKDAVRNMRYWQKYVENDPTTLSKKRKEQLETQVDIYLESH